MQIVRDFVHSGKSVAAICHAPWLLIEAEALHGKKATSFKSIKVDVKNAGANWVDEPVVVDGNIITSRCPDDLKAFVTKIIDAIEGKTDQREVA
jgi:protease I